MSLQLIAIWAEGYRANGDWGLAVKLGEERAENLERACDMYAARNESFRANYDPVTMTHWGCRLFDNEKDARVRFG